MFFPKLIELGLFRLSLHSNWHWKLFRCGSCEVCAGAQQPRNHPFVARYLGRCWTERPPRFFAALSLHVVSPRSSPGRISPLRALDSLLSIVSALRKLDFDPFLKWKIGFRRTQWVIIGMLWDIRRASSGKLWFYFLPVIKNN